MFACSVALPGVGVAVALPGVAVTVWLRLALEFALFAVLQAAQKTASASKSRKDIVRRIEVPPM